MNHAIDLSTEQIEDVIRVKLKGDWVIKNSNEILNTLATGSVRTDSELEVDLSGVKSLDTFGVLILLKQLLKNNSGKLKLIEATEAQRGTIDLIQQIISSDKREEVKTPINLLDKLIRLANAVFQQAYEMLSFLGETGFLLLSVIFRPSLIRPKELVAHLQHSSINAIPIISLVTFLIGTVVAYLFVSQASRYGADLYIAEVVSIGMFREFSPIIVAVIMAGRSGSAYTAQIGTMKMNEEIDAIRVLGLSPFHVLVIPRLLALIISMPLLVFVGDLIGIGGGMVIAYNFLGLTPLTFLSRLHTDLCCRSLIIGLIKAPIFALFIATIGCKLGFSAEKNARSVGLSTTSSVVQSVVWVIILDALFAVILQRFDI